MLEQATVVDRMRPERVEYLGPVEGDPDRALVHRPVIGDVGQILETRHGAHAVGSKISDTPSIALMGQNAIGRVEYRIGRVVFWKT